ncbi:Phosphoribosylglycinamide formyltransferase [Rhodobacteraceae bacterium SB2]|nr:Phosphoribosylglycinamide formyltransferase [Rhodobacteraceae bacterium SB2]
MTIKVLLVIGSDKITNNLFRDFEEKFDNVTIVEDHSRNIVSSLKLVLKGRIPVLAAFLMFAANLVRKKLSYTKNRSIIRNNSDLLEIYNDHKPEVMILFRAGLVITRRAFPKNSKIYNVHSAKLPKFGGLASIYRALKSGDYSQCASLHVVTDKIDGGQVLLEVPYFLDPNKSYLENEEQAYNAGIILLENAIANDFS